MFARSQGPRRCRQIRFALFFALISAASSVHGHSELRSLRGGRSYGRGGSGSYNRGGRGGGSWNSNNRNWNSNRNRNSSMGKFGRILGAFALGAVGLALMAMVLPALGIGGAAACLPACCAACLGGCCCGLFGGGAAGAAAASAASGQGGGVFGGFGEALSPGRDDSRFEEQVERARSEVEASKMGQQNLGPQPLSGIYMASYIDMGTSKNASLKLRFMDTGNGFAISGEGQDSDGITTVEEGQVNYDGMAWWRERTISGDVGLQVLSRGKFNFQDQTFQGTWFASTSEYGSYTSFRLSLPQPNTQGSQPQPYIHGSDPHPFLQGSQPHPYSHGGYPHSFPQGSQPPSYSQGITANPHPVVQAQVVGGAVVPAAPVVSGSVMNQGDAMGPSPYVPVVQAQTPNMT